jgi:hypothetical protein
LKNVLLNYGGKLDGIYNWQVTARGNPDGAVHYIAASAKIYSENISSDDIR